MYIHPSSGPQHCAKAIQRVLFLVLLGQVHLRSSRSASNFSFKSCLFLASGFPNYFFASWLSGPAALRGNVFQRSLPEAKRYFTANRKRLRLPCCRPDCVAQHRTVNPKNFFGELKRRNVYKVAVAYAVVAWLLIQVATQVFPFFEIPNWGVRLVVLLIVIGFPIALVLAWAFCSSLRC